MGKMRRFLGVFISLFILFFVGNLLAATANCPAGTYVPARNSLCYSCTAGSYCPGGNLTTNSSSPQGIYSCPATYPSSESGASSKDECYKNIEPGYMLMYISDTSVYTMTCASDGGSYCPGGNVYYKQSGEYKCPTNYPKTDSIATSINDCFVTMSAGKQYFTGIDGFGIYDCRNGNYCPGGDIHYEETGAVSCPTLYSNSDLGADNINDCYSILPSGKYINDSTGSAGSCPANSYCPGGKIMYGTDGGKKSCPKAYPSSTAGATSKDNCYKMLKPGEAMFLSSGENSDPIVYTCNKGNYCPGYEVYYGGSGETACPAAYPDSAAGASSINSCYKELQPGTMLTYVSDSYAMTTPCPNGGGYYCPGGNVYYKETGQIACPAGYPNTNSESIATSINECFTTLKEGTYYDGNQTKTCSSGSYCPGGKIMYGESGKVSCPVEYPNSDSGAQSIDDCYAIISAGKYLYAGEGSYFEIECTQGNYCPGGKIYYGENGLSKCAGIFNMSDAGADSITDCYALLEPGQKVEKYLLKTCETLDHYCPGGKFYNDGKTGNAGELACPEIYPSAKAGATSIEECYVSIPGGVYIDSNENKAKDCPAGNYCPGGNIYYGVDGLAPCPSSYPESDVRNDNVNKCYKTIMAGTMLLYRDGGSALNIPCTEDSGTYCPGGKVYLSQSGEYTCPENYPQTVGIATSIDECFTTMTAGKQYFTGIEGFGIYDCRNGNYCPGGRVYYEDNGAQACPKNYPSSDIGASSINGCYVILPESNGVYMNTETNEVSQCTQGNYCPGGKIMYGETGMYACPNGYPSSDPNANAKEKCYESIPEGKEAFWSNENYSPIIYDCEEGYYCVGVQKYYFGSSNLDYKKACPTTHPDSDAGSRDISNCYRNLSAGKEFSDNEEISCKEGFYCSGAKIQYGEELTGATVCPEDYPESDAGADSINACYKTIEGGYAMPTAGEVQICAAGSYKEGHTLYYPNTSTCNTCPNNFSDGEEGAQSVNECKKIVPAGSYMGMDYQIKQCAAGTYSEETYVTPTLPASSCIDCSGRNQYSEAGAAACSTVTSGYYSTGCNEDGNKCTGQEQCSGYAYCENGEKKACPYPGTHVYDAGFSNSTPDGATSWEQCELQIKSAEKFPGLCTSGIVIAKPKSVDDTQWNTTNMTVKENVAAVPGAEVKDVFMCAACSNYTYSAGGENAVCATTTSGYYATGCSEDSGNQCTGQEQCTAGSYCANGTITSCPTAYPSSPVLSTSVDACYRSVPAGSFLENTNGTVNTCAQGTYKEAHDVSYNMTSSCDSCPEGYSDGNGAVSQNECVGSFTKTGVQQEPENPTGCGEITTEACEPGTCSYQKKYDGTVVEDCTPSNCVKAITSVTAEEGHYSDALMCPACESGYSSPVGATSAQQCTKSCSVDCIRPECPENSATCEIGTETESGTMNQVDKTCDAVAQTCSMTFTCKPGYEKTGNECVPETYEITLNKNGGTGEINGSTGEANATQSCKYGVICDLPSEGITKYGFTFTGWGDNAGCTGGTFQMTFTGPKTVYACWSQQTTQCQAGKYYNGTEHVECPSGKYCPGTGFANVGQEGCASSCPIGFSGSDLGATNANSCYATCEAKVITGGTTTAVNDKTYYNGNMYPACEYNASCDAGYAVEDNGTAQATCSKCSDGYNCVGGTTAKVECPAGSFCPDGIAQTCPDGGTSVAGAKVNTECFKTCPPTLDIDNGRGVSTGNQNYDGSKYPACQFTAQCDENYVPKDSPSESPTCVWGDSSKCPAGYYCPEGSAGPIVCPEGGTSDAGAATVNECYKKCPETLEIANGQGISTGNQNYDGSKYPACQFTAQCDENYVSKDSPSENPTCVWGDSSKCPVGFYCPADAVEPVACPDEGTSDGGATDATQCYKVINSYQNFKNGVANAKCNYNGEDYSSCVITKVVSCNAGYWNNTDNEFECSSVSNGFYSPDGELEQTECPAGYVGSNQNAASFTDCYKNCELEVSNSTSVTPVKETVYGVNETEYESCLFNVVCEEGYNPINNGSENPSCAGKEYTVFLNKNGGTGSTPESIQCEFGATGCQLPDTSGLSKTGYVSVPKWCSTENGEEPCYEANKLIESGVSEDGTDVTLYAVWEPGVYTVTLDDMSANSAAAPSKVYLKYATGWFSDATTQRHISRLTSLPVKLGFDLAGYYSEENGGVLVIDSDGSFKVTSEALTMTSEDTSIYARWSESLVECEAGTYYTGNGKTCTTCPAGSYCTGGTFPEESGEIGGINSCADLGDGSWNTSDAGAKSESGCYKACEEYEVINGTAIPVSEKAGYPKSCEYKGISDSGNPCQIVDGECVENMCKNDYEMINGECRPCAREHALSYKTEGNCVVATCEIGYHPNGKACEDDIKVCSAPNAIYAEQKWNSSKKAFDACKVVECDAGYHVASNACVKDVQSCTVKNGTGFKEWNYAKNDWDECIATYCEPGYTNDPSETNDRISQCGECANKYSVLGELAASSYVEGCEIASCLYQGELYNLENNECVPICPQEEYEDETGTMVWDSSRKKCVRTCKEGYTMW